MEWIAVDIQKTTVDKWLRPEHFQNISDASDLVIYMKIYWVKSNCLESFMGKNFLRDYKGVNSNGFYHFMIENINAQKWCLKRLHIIKNMSESYLHKNYSYFFFCACGFFAHRNPITRHASICSTKLKTRVDHPEPFLATKSKPYMVFMVTWQPYSWQRKKSTMLKNLLKEACIAIGWRKTHQNNWKILKFVVSWEPNTKPYTFMVPCKTIKIKVKTYKKNYGEQFN